MTQNRERGRSRRLKRHSRPVRGLTPRARRPLRRLGTKGLRLREKQNPGEDRLLDVNSTSELDSADQNPVNEQEGLGTAPGRGLGTAPGMGPGTGPATGPGTIKDNENR